MSKYSQKIQDVVREGDKKLLGVRLGLACIRAEIPVQVIAKWMSVTRQGVYYWFTGVTDIASKNHPKVEQIIRVLNAARDNKELPAATLEEAMRVVKRYRSLMK